MPDPLLTRRAVVSAKIETTYNVDSTPTQATAILVEEPDYKVDATILTRNFSRNSISRIKHRVGRKIASMTFTHELRGGGSVTAASRLGSLLRMCGMQEVQHTTGPSLLGAVKADPGNAGPTVTWATAASATAPAEPVMFTLTVVVGGASGTATVKVDPDANAIGAGIAPAIAATAITTGTAFVLKTGVTFTPSWTGTLVAGDKYYVWWFPAGYRYQPVSTGFESGTIYMWMDGLLHKMTGARGSFTVEAEAGQFGKIQFTFWGQYVDPVDQALPTAPSFEQTDPPIWELANLHVGSYKACVAKLSYDQGNTVSPRPCANSLDGYEGVVITDREAKGGLDPEMALVATEDFWGRLKASTTFLVRTRFGTSAGNQIWMLTPQAQYTGLTYQSREGFRVLDAGLAYNGLSGDDEVILYLG